jgi:hypothetical protein
MTSRVRLSVMATHHADELARAARTLGSVALGLGFDPRLASPSAAQPASPSAPQPASSSAPQPASAERRSAASAERRPPAPPQRRSPARDARDAAPQLTDPQPGGVFDFEAPEPVRRAA